MIYSNSKRVESEKMAVEIITLKDRIVGYQDTIHCLRQSLKAAELTKEKQKATYEILLPKKMQSLKNLPIGLPIWLLLLFVTEQILEYQQHRLQ